MSALEAVLALDEGLIAEGEALEVKGCLSLLKLFEEATKGAEFQAWQAICAGNLTAVARDAF